MDDNLLGQLLISMPNLRDPRFEKTVILICEFTEEAVMGLILNKKIENLTFGNLFEKTKISKSSKIIDQAIYFGGPVHTKQGFILHSNDKNYKTTEKILTNVSLSTSIEILEDFSSNQGPDFKRIFLGCSVWDYHQFNREMLENSWLTLKASEDLIFDQKLDDTLWNLCMLKLGIKTENLVSFYGNA